MDKIKTKIEAYVCGASPAIKYEVRFYIGKTRIIFDPIDATSKDAALEVAKEIINDLSIKIK